MSMCSNNDWMKSSAKSVEFTEMDDIKCDSSEDSFMEMERQEQEAKDKENELIYYYHCQIQEREHNQKKSIQQTCIKRSILSTSSQIDLTKCNSNHQNAIKRSLSSPSLSTLNLLNEANTKSLNKLESNLPDLMELYKTIPSLKFKLNIENILRRSQFHDTQEHSFILCNHRSNCAEHAFISGFLRTFAASYVLKTTLSLFQHALFGKLIKFNGKGIINVSTLKSIYTNRDSVSFAQFLGLMSLTYKGLLCLLRRYFKTDDMKFKSIAGFIAGFWIILDNPRRQQSYAMNGIIRAISDAIRLGIFYDKVPILKGFNMIMFTISQLILLNASFWKPKTINPTLRKFMLRLGNFNEKKVKILSDGVKTGKFVKCCPSLHSDESCSIYNIKNFATSFKNASMIYLAVHFLPILLFEPRKVFSNPNKYFKQSLRNTIISCLFVSSYNFMVNGNICFWRNMLKKDYWFSGIFCALFASLTLLIENVKRRSELTLYCIPRSLEIIFRLFTKQKYPKIYNFLRSKYLRVFSFQICIAIWLTIRTIPKGKEISNGLNMTLMKLIFGTKN